MGKQMQPIRSLETVNRITRTLSLLDDDRGRRVFMLWLVGISMGMRIGDMVDLKVGDLRGQKAYTYTPHKQRHKKGVHPITLPVGLAFPKQKEERHQDKGTGQPHAAGRKEAGKGEPRRDRQADGAAGNKRNRQAVRD